jgi:hypothetical protein
MYNDTDFTIRYVSQYFKNVTINKQMNNNAYFNVLFKIMKACFPLTELKQYMNLPFSIAAQNTKSVHFGDL